jgi:signal transduction histidine kinase
MMKFIRNFEQRSPAVLILVSLGFLAVVGIIDYLTGFQISISVFYLLAVGLAAWFVGKGFGFFFAALSVAVSILGDLAAGAHYSSPFIPIWNATVLLVFYFIVVWLLANLRASQKGLENKVRERTKSLTKEIAERARLEKEILEISEREQRHIGHDLHDSICQHWTATAMAGQVLSEKLAAKSMPEAADAKGIVKLAEDGTAMTRNLAHGIAPVEMDMEGLAAALQELAANTSKMFKIPCAFDCDAAPMITEAATATHLYRIAQEALSNAIRHGKPNQIVITLSHQNERAELTIEDDGVGLPDDWEKSHGLGTRIMAHRAAMIGGTFSVEANPTGGTFVSCSFPVPVQT